MRTFWCDCLAIVNTSFIDGWYHPSVLKSTYVCERFFLHAVLGLSIEPNEPNEESESVSIMANVLSPILDMLLIDEVRFSCL